MKDEQTESLGAPCFFFFPYAWVCAFPFFWNQGRRSACFARCRFAVSHFVCRRFSLWPGDSRSCVCDPGLLRVFLDAGNISFRADRTSPLERDSLFGPAFYRLLLRRLSWASRKCLFKRRPFFIVRQPNERMHDNKSHPRIDITCLLIKNLKGEVKRGCLIRNALNSLNHI